MDVEGHGIGQRCQAGRLTGAGASLGPSSLAELGRLRVVPVVTDGQSARWDAILDDEHFLGSGPFAGKRLRYLVESPRWGTVAALAFSAPARRLAARDRYIGWSETTRQDRLQRIVCNSRFLIRPGVSVPGLASHVLARCLRQLPRDWAAHVGETPVLVETFVDRTRHRGGCYRAANWQYVGDTAGRGRNDTDHQRPRSVKAVYLYPLRRDWRRQLGGRAAPARAPDSDDWARHEFAELAVGDQRLRERVITVARAFAANSTAHVPEACGTRACTKAAYRVFANPKVTMDALLTAHYQATTGRCQNRGVVLAVQDTTSLNYTAHTAIDGLGPIARRTNGAQGLLVHDTMAFSTEGTPLGLVDVQAWARKSDKHPPQQLTSDSRAVGAKESTKWLGSHARAGALQGQLEGTRVVSVADREGDTFELLAAAQQPGAADILVRAQHARQLAGGGRLMSHLDAQPQQGEVELHVPPKGNQPARTARMAVRFARVTVAPPQGKGQGNPAPVTLDAVRTTEIDPPAGTQPLDWTLVTTVATETFAQAQERIRWYAARWQIEVYHRTFKSGCRVENRQLGNADRLEACLAVDLIVAWRVFWLTKRAREAPDTPCSVFFEPDQWKTLLLQTSTTPDPDPGPDQEPTLRQATRRVAQLGGFIATKGEPGPQTVWRGLQRLDDMTDAYRRVMALIQSGREPP